MQIKQPIVPSMGQVIAPPNVRNRSCEGRLVGCNPTPLKASGLSQEGVLEEVGQGVAMIFRAVEGPEVKLHCFQTFYNLCPFSRFANESLVRDAWSGFLVSKRHVMTARHTLNGPLEGLHVAFGLSAFANRDGYLDLPRRNHYRVVGLAGSNPDCDTVCLELDRPVEDVEPVCLQATKAAADSDVLLVGHPRGLALKLARGHVRQAATDGSGTFTAVVDAYGGQSGAPVFSAESRQVVGMLLGSWEDLIVTQSGCRMMTAPLFRAQKCVDSGVLQRLLS